MFDSITPSIHGSVLVVEDHADSREILTVLFRSLGCTVFEANDAEEALPLVAAKRLDLIVTDLGLPGMDGLEFVRRVRVKNGNHLKIALLTAYNPRDFLRAARKAGCDLVLGKPIDLDKFDCLVNLISESESCPADAEVHYRGHVNFDRVEREENAMTR